jgi:formylglycine-generating enzyme required for sulfatase activity
VTTHPIMIFEPLGARELLTPVRLGADETLDVRVPDNDPTRFLTFDQLAGRWVCRATGSGITLNALALESEETHSLQDGDVLRLGDSVIRVALSGKELALQVEHLEGNLTLAPVITATGLQFDEQAEEIITASVRAKADSAQDIENTTRINQRFIWISLAGIGLVLAALILLLGRLQPVVFTVEPAAAEVSGSGLGWASGNTLFILPGERVVTAIAKGYKPLQQAISVRPDETMSLELRLEPLPGILQVDTGGIAAELFIDGARAGSVPGDISVSRGTRTLMVRAERFFDEIRQIEIEGYGARQVLSVPLRPSWGTIAVSADRPEASLILEGREPLSLPGEVDLPAGLHRLEITAAGAKTWRGAILVEAGARQTVGPVSLGAPDALWTIRSRPSGASVTVNGVFRGRTPVEVTLTPQMEQQIVVGQQGYAQVERRVRPEPGERQTLQLDLDVRQVSLIIEGEPAGAEVYSAERRLGQAPLETRLPARMARLELRKEGFSAQRLDVDLSAGVARRVDYRLVPQGRDPNWRPPESQVTLQQGPVLRLIEGGRFTMGSGRREQGRRSNEWQRQVTLQRTFYIGTREVSNSEYRRFRKEHASGFIGKRSLDLDRQPVTSVSWEDAVEYCNWLSAQNGLQAAYIKQDGRWVLTQPVTTGFRLPTEAEWEFITRFDAERGLARRYPWGMELPPPPRAGNLAGEEAVEDLPRVLTAWQDEHVVVAPTGSYPANALGLNDLLGNVSEWVHDAYATVAEGDPLDPTGPATASRLRVIKGASWRTSNYAELRAAWRDGRDGPADDLGFRVARYVEEKAQ